MAAAQALESSGELEHQEAVQRSQVIQQDWAKLRKLIEQRIKLGLQYTTFHKKAQQVKQYSVTLNSPIEAQCAKTKGWHVPLLFILGM